jgi:hypothetical protein
LLQLRVAQAQGQLTAALLVSATTSQSLLTELGLEHCELLVLELLVSGDLLGEELLERLGHLALPDRGHVLNSLSSRREAVNSLKLEPESG